ncbi:glycosyltransferase family 4 protein [Candidatus Uhrbacteria bacterium]|nr:glycosyltransferase family 4 protein [Candidatus Uhrbacteria bacterium]
MKIFLINNLYPPYTRGGAERVVKTIAQELRRQKHDVRVITTVPSWSVNMKALVSGGWIRETVDGITVYRIATANLFPYWTIGKHNALLRLLWHVFDLFAFETASILKRLLKQEKPDVVMTHNLMGLGFLIPRTIRRSGIRQIHTVHDVQLAVPSGLITVGRRPSFIVMAGLQLYERLLRWLIGSPNVVVSPSQWLLDFYTERGFFSQSKKIVLSNPVLSVIASPAKQSTKIATARHDVDPRNDSSTIRFLYVGQLEEHKGIVFLIETFKNLQLRLDIIGTGSLLQKIKKITAGDPRITVHGAVPHEKLSEFYANADALIVPSLVHENAPTVIFEALAHGVPVIASRVGGIPEFVRDGENGWLFDAGNSDALTKALQTAMEKKSLPQRAKFTASPEDYCAKLLHL